MTKLHLGHHPPGLAIAAASAALAAQTMQDAQSPPGHAGFDYS